MKKINIILGLTFGDALSIIGSTSSFLMAHTPELMKSELTLKYFYHIHERLILHLLHDCYFFNFNIWYVLLN